MTNPSKLAQQAAELCAKELVAKGTPQHLREGFERTYSDALQPIISSVIEPLERIRLGDFVNRTLKMWEDAAKLPEMAGVRFDVAEEILRNTYSVAEMEALPESELAQARQDEKEAEARYQACYAELTKVQASLASLSQERDRLYKESLEHVTWTLLNAVDKFELKDAKDRLSSLSEEVGLLRLHLKAVADTLRDHLHPETTLERLVCGDCQAIVDQAYKILIETEAAADKCRALGVKPWAKS